MFTSLLPLVFLFAIFYFIVIRPQQKQAKAHKQMLTELVKGDKIVTAGGFIVEIEKVEETFYRVKMNDGVSARLSKESVAKRYEEA
ncbi:MAG: preprotein translocase subunit YajC [Sulfurovum sp. PC08-66]|nr:MAG: preprotein translocase subunit YajC [Sulfurovum sp. PC08-66]KIM12491.1 MAG: preprotein translocase subunit YajC [Sulfuricurvum sp. PC08-66]